uniref:hypothetical protein n=1 Tax=Enterocloster clostridioformis TaxID=1531 RepID=UPI001C3E09BE|nr:hypothetical protein [Enterocloster clostridioformis]
MAKILTVDIPEPMLRELGRIAKTESKRQEREITPDQLAEKAIRIYIRQMRKKQKENLR